MTDGDKGRTGSNSKYSRALAEECARWVEENGLREYGGATVKEFCASFGISDRTYEIWMKRRPEFAEMIAAARAVYKAGLERRIVRSLGRSAVGFDWTQTVTEKGVDSDGQEYVRKVTEKNISEPPNVGAAVFLLTNLAPERWKNRQAQDVKSDVTVRGLQVNVSSPDVKTALERIAGGSADGDDKGL